MSSKLLCGAVSCRPISAQDRDDFFSLQADPAVYLQNGRLVDIGALFSHYLSMEHAWAIEVEGAFAGTAALSTNSLTKAVNSLCVYELSFSLKPGYWGRGYAFCAVQAVCAHAFSVLGADAILAGAFADNARSHKLLDRLGFGSVIFSRPAKDKSGRARSEQLRLLVNK